MLLQTKMEEEMLTKTITTTTEEATADNDTAKLDPAMEKLEKYFKQKRDKDGVVLTAGQLLQFSKLKKLGISKQKIYAFLQRQSAVGHFLHARKTKEYQSMSVIRPGVYHIDFAEFRKEWAGSNKGCTGFLVAVENFTNKLFALPCRGKGTEQWLNAISEFVEKTRDIRTIFSDRDTVATSLNFRDRLREKYGFAWYFLKKGHKAFLAERYIGFLKTKLSQILEYKKQKRWIEFLAAICSEYNQTKIEGTSYRRQAVNRKNFSHFLSQLLKDSEPELRFNSFKAGPFQNSEWNRRIFKYSLGDRVLLARRATWDDQSEKQKVFTKTSLEGGFGKRVFTVSGRQLRASKMHKSYVQVYSLAELGPSLHFYANELKPAPLHF
jgi:hypothetical protein